jgi:uncharacterized membrane protein YcaP (DUF421 family)
MLTSVSVLSIQLISLATLPMPSSSEILAVQPIQVIQHGQTLQKTIKISQKNTKENVPKCKKGETKDCRGPSKRK